MRIFLIFWEQFMYVVTSRVVIFLTFEYLLIFRALVELKLDFVRKLGNNQVVNNHRWRQIQTFVVEFENLYSLAPFFKFLQTYLQTILYIVFMHVFKRHLDSEIGIYIINYVFCLIITFHVVQQIDRSNSKLKMAAKKLHESAALSTNEKFKQLADEINQNYEFKLTGFGLFNLNKSLITGMVASLISFTVLFMELTSN